MIDRFYVLLFLFCTAIRHYSFWRAWHYLTLTLSLTVFSDRFRKVLYFFTQPPPPPLTCFVCPALSQAYSSPVPSPRPYDSWLTSYSGIANALRKLSSAPREKRKRENELSYRDVNEPKKAEPSRAGPKIQGFGPNRAKTEPGQTI